MRISKARVLNYLVNLSIISIVDTETIIVSLSLATTPIEGRRAYLSTRLLSSLP